MRLMSSIRTASALLGRPRPIILYHKPTARCDCRCRFCDFWKDQPESGDVLASELILDLIDRAGAAGMSFYTVWGGEPLLVEDLPAWLVRARRAGLYTTVCTAGTRLPDRAAEIAPHIDQLLLSMEAVGERQDEIRRTPGLFEKIESGLDKYRRAGGDDVIIWCNVTTETIDQARPVAEFAREHKVLVEYFPAAIYDDYNEDIVLSGAERREVFAEILGLKRSGWPVFNTTHALELMRDSNPFKCNLARLAVQVDHAGKLWACEPRVIPGLAPYGDISEIDLCELPRSREYRDNARRLASCNACLLPCVGNMADNLVLQGLRRFGDRVRFSLKNS